MRAPPRPEILEEKPVKDDHKSDLFPICQHIVQVARDAIEKEDIAKGNPSMVHL